MTDAVPRKPRNTRLTAYYGLSTPAATPSSPPAPIPSGRAEALAHAAHLTRTLSLPALLQHSARLRRTSESLERDLHVSTRRYYAHLSSASDISRAAIEQASSLRPACAAVSGAAALARAVAARLQDARARVDALEGSRRAALLRDAASRLAAGLMPAYRELADLCTDPAAARDRLFLMARRAAVVGPAVETLAATGGGDRFADAARDLAAAKEAVADELARRGEKDDPYGLPVPDALQLRRLLGEERHVLLEAFYKAFGRQLCRRRPAEAARASAGQGALAEAELCVRFAADQTVPAAFGVGDRFAEVFAVREDDGQAWQAFAVWLSDVLDECVAARARGATRGRDGKAWGAADDVRSYLAAIDGMLKASAAAAAARQGEGADAATRTAATHVNEVMQAMGTELRTGAQDAVIASTESAWQRVVRDILSGARGADAVEELLRQVKERRRKNEEVGAGEAAEGEHRVLRDVAAFARREAELDQGVAQAARAGMLVREVGRRARGEIGAEFQQASARQLCSVREQVLERVHDVLHARLQSIEQADGQEGGADGSQAVSDAVAILQEAGKVGEELDVSMLRMQAAEDAFLGVDMGLIKGVRDVWTEMVRRASISRARGARALELDALELGRQLGTDGAFAAVGAAALERCAEGGSGLGRAQLVAGVGRRGGARE